MAITQAIDKCHERPNEQDTDQDVRPMSELTTVVGDTVDHATDVEKRTDRVMLTVPAKPHMWSVVRVTASALANRMNFTFEDIQDLRLAVTELCTACSTTAAEDALCECEFVINGNRVQLNCRVSPVTPDEDITGDDDTVLTNAQLSARILEATVDSYDVGEVKDGTRSGSLSKFRSPTA